MDVTLNGLDNSIFFKVMHFETTKEIFDKLQIIYEKYENVNKDKLETYRIQFESLNMNEEEEIVYFFLSVDEIVNT